MILFLNEWSKLYRRKQFLLLSAVLFAFGLLTLFLHERNTGEYLSRNDQSDAYIQEKTEAEEAYLTEYQTFLNGMQERADKIRSSSAYWGSSQDEAQDGARNHTGSLYTYRVRELDRTVSEYQKLQGIKLDKGDYTEVKKYAAWLPGLLVEILFLILLLYYGFFEDKDHNRYLLLRSTWKGRSGLAAAKLLVCICSAVCFTVFFETAVYFILCLLYGSSDLSAPVQSVSSFRNSVLNISIRGMLVRAVLLKALVLCTVMSLLCFFSVIYGKISLPVLFITIILGLELLIWYLIKPEMTIRVFHLINLFSLADPRESIGSFYLLNIFSQPVQAEHIAIIIAFMIVVVSSGAGVCIFSRKNQVQKETFIEKWMLKLRSRLHVLQEGSNLFFLELYKILVQEKWFLCLMLVIYYINLFQGVFQSQNYASAEAAAYQLYAMRIQGKMDGSQERFIKEEEERLESMREEIRQLQEEPEESDNTLDENNAFRIAQLNSELTINEPGLALVKEQVRKLTITGKQQNQYFVNEKAYTVFFMDYRSRLFQWLTAVSSLLLLTAGLYSADEQSGMSRLVHSTERGRKHLSYIRYGIMLLFMMILYLGTEIPTLIQWYQIDEYRCFSAAFSDFVSFGFHSGLRIGTCMVLVSVGRLVFLLLFGTASLQLSKILKNEMMTVVVLAGAAALIVIFGLIFSTDLTGLILRIAGVRFTR